MDLMIWWEVEADTMELTSRWGSVRWREDKKMLSATLKVGTRSLCLMKQREIEELYR